MNATGRRGLAAGAVLCGLTLTTAAQVPKSGFDPAAFDRGVAPRDDLYRYVNGDWLARTSIPADRVTYGAFGELADKTEADLHALIEDLASRSNRLRGSPAQQIVDLYASVVDEQRIERLGAEPIAPELRKIEAIASGHDLAAEAGYLSSIAAGGPFGGTVGSDPANASAPVARVTQGGILLPDRDYYLSADPAFSAVRAKYEQYLARIFTLIGRATPEPDAKDVLALETALAQVSWTETETRAAWAETYTRFTLRQLAAEMPGFDWQAWAHPQGLDRSPVVILAQPSFFKAFAAMVPHIPLNTWRAWLASRYVTAAAPYLSSAFDRARFDFFGTILTGQELPRTRWKRGVAMVNGYLGDAVGRVYVERHFSPAAKKRVRGIVERIVEAYREAIRDSDWMSARAKREALAKLSALSIRVGYPVQWRSYDGLDIRAGDLFGNWQRSLAFENRLRLGDVAGTAASAMWVLPPQTVNAYYTGATNEIVVPAAILQPPVFDPEADDAVNYGAAGALVGHEIAHAFDGRGRQFDATGAARDWWTPEDAAKFDARLRALAAQLSSYEPLAGAHVNGALAAAETMADIAGLSIAWRAYKRTLTGDPPVIDGLTGAQRFCMGWVRIWRAKERDDYVRSQLQISAHLPPAFRAGAALVNTDAFYDTFAVAPGHRLYLPPAERIRIW